MALTVVDNRLILNEADSVTGWTATDGPTLFTSAPNPIESTGCLAMQVSNNIQDAYTTITSDNFTSGSLSIWMLDRAEFDTTANVGIGIQVGDGTNRIAYAVGGSDGTAFRHDTGPVKWACFILDLGKKPTNFATLAGSEASLNEAAITQVGVYYSTIVKSVGGADNCFWDIIRWADPGVGIEVYGGTVGTPEGLSTLAAADRSTGNQQAYGVIRELATGVYGVQGNINLGDNTSTNDTYINISGETIAFENRDLSAGNYYRFTVNGNGTGITDINADDSVFTVSAGANAQVNWSSSNATADSRNCVWSGFDRGVIIGGTGSVWTGNSFQGCGQVESAGASLANSAFVEYTGSESSSALFWNTTEDTNGRLDGCSFTSASDGVATHAIEFNTSMTNTSITLVDIDFNGYSTSNNQGNSVLNVLATTGTLTINVSGGSGTVSYDTAGATVSIVNAVNVTFTGMRDDTEIRIFAAGTETELAGIEEATDGTTDNRSFTAAISAGTVVDYRIVNLAYKIIEVYNFTWPTSTQSLPIQQQIDRNYNNPA